MFKEFSDKITKVALTSLMFCASAYAGSSSGGEEFLSTTEAVPPNVLFVVDRSSNMASSCPAASNTATAYSCFDTVISVISAMTQHYDWARYGLVTTSDNSHSSRQEQWENQRVIPLGSPFSEFSSAITSISTHSTTTNDLTEAISNAYSLYLRLGATADDTDDDGDGFTEDWTEAPIEYSCQDTHIIVFTANPPSNDENPTTIATYNMNVPFPTYTDINCNSSGITTTYTTSDQQCYYDQASLYLYNFDARSSLTNTQNVIVHTIGINTSSNTVADSLYDNASDLIGGAGAYTSTDGSFSAMLSATMSVISSALSGTYSRSTPMVSADGNYLIFSYYEMDSSNPLAEGHVRGYEIDNDPTSSTYGQVKYDGPTAFGGALWDGGTLLVSRPVTASEYNEEDRDGFGKRDIYTFYEAGVSLLPTESNTHRRQGFDRGFATYIGADTTALGNILDTTDTTYDLNEDGSVNASDLQTLIDFARGLPTSVYPYLDTVRGNWKLGDAPNAVPVVAQTDEDLYTLDPSYRRFLDELESAGYPDIVLSPANDGMLHAFALEEDSASGTVIGEELWAWIPGYLLYRSHDATWAGRLIDQMLYGRTFLFDGTPVVEDVWIDSDGDGSKDCTSVPSNCEWRRVVVVAQGKGGPVTMALDITDTSAPTFLWEQLDESDSTAIGYTTSRPVVGNVYDSSDISDPVDRYVVFWGSGRSVPNGINSTYYKSTEGNVYMWAIGDDYHGTMSVGYQDDNSTGSPRGDNNHPEASTYTTSLNLDSDSEYEYAYISAALAAVDVDSDGDVDTLYFPITTAYRPTSEGGSGLSQITDPGSSWMYKACINPSNPEDLTWAEFYDPVDDGALITRPEVYYSATTSWHSDGQLGIYWGTGTPYDRESVRRGYFFAVKDNAPMSCTTFTATPITDCGANGVYQLSPGEGLTADPTAYAGVVYFSTWTPASNRCNGGTGKLYGIRFDDCTPGIDTDGDGTADTSDSAAISSSGNYISGITVTDSGSIIYGTSGVTTDGSSSAVGSIDSATNPFLGTATVSWMEVF
jgi:hypothetical protein